MAKTLLLSCPDSGEVFSVKVDAQGYLTSDDHVLAFQCRCQSIAGTDGILYVGCHRGDKAFIRTIKNEVPLPSETPTTGPPAYLSVSPCGRFLVNASFHGNCVTVARVQVTGEPEQPAQCLQGLNKAHCCVYRSAGETLETYELWVACLGLNCVKIFRQNKQTGRLQEEMTLEASAPGAGPRHIVFHPKLPVAYCSNELKGTVDVFHAETGEILDTANVLLDDFIGQPWAADIVIANDGRLLIASERCRSTVAVFSVGGGDGKLRRLSVCGTDAIQPRAMAVAFDKVLIVAGQKSNNLVAYQVTDGGDLRKISELAVGQGPMWIKQLE